MKNIFKILLIAILLCTCFIIVQTRNFNGFQLAHFYEERTKVCRDYQERYKKEWSYKIESTDYNDFMIYKKIQVKKNTAYKVSCMVKTQNIQSEDEKNYTGFNICLKDSLEKSTSLTGTNDWTKLDFYFNSLNNDTIDIAFRLGGNEGNCKGIVWFSNITIEEGIQQKTNEWDFAVFMINHTNAQVKNEKITEDLTNTQISAIKNDLERFKYTAQEFSKGNIKINYDIFMINKPLNKISYEEETDYYVSSQDVYPLINSYLYQKKNYDHVFVVANIGDSINGNKIEWIGLGGMLYDNMGYSNIRISNNILSSYQYSNFNYFPEEVMLHEFLHTIERNSNQLKNETIALHNYEKYGYKSEVQYGLKQWYIDYMQKNIKGSLGLEKETFYTQPTSTKNFRLQNVVTNILYDQQNLIQKISESISSLI